MRLTSSGALNINGSFGAAGNLRAGTAGSVGMAEVIAGNGTYTGYVQFVTAANVRVCYIGFVTSSGAVQYVCENGGGHAFTGGDLTSSGNITAYFSDERLKTKVRSIEHATYKLLSLNGFYYVENKLAQSFGYKGDKLHVGLSAQEVKNVLPEAVSLAPFDRD